MKARVKTFMATAAGAVVMAALGWTLGGESLSRPQGEATASNERKPHQQPPLKAHRKGKPEEVVAYLDAIRRCGSADERLRATIRLANSLPAAELGGWIENCWFDIRDGCDFDFFTQIILQRWQTEDPASYLAYGVAHGSMDNAAVLAAWAARNPEEVFDYFKAHPNHDLATYMLDLLAQTSPARALECLLTLTASDGHFGCSWSGAEVMRKLSANDSAGFLKALDSLPESWKSQAQTAYAGEQLKASFPDEIRRLWDIPGGWAFFNEAVAGDAERGWDGASARRLLDELPNLPLEWLQHLDRTAVITSSNYRDAMGIDWEGAGVPADVAERLRGKVLSGALHSGDTEQAVGLLAAGNVDADARISAFESLLGSFHSGSPEAEAFIAQLGPEENREAARQYLAKKDAPSKDGEPDEPVTFAVPDGTPDSPSDTLVASPEWETKASQARAGSTDQVAQMIADFRALPDDQKVSAALGIAEGSGFNPQSGESALGEAVLYLLSHADTANAKTTSRILAGLSSNYAVALADADPGAATMWVGSLPEGEPKLWAEKNLAANWAQYDPDAMQRWVGSLPPASRVQVQEYLKQPRR